MSSYSYVDWVLKNRRFMFAIVFLLCGLGYYALEQLPIDAVPDITNIQVMVNVKTGSLAPEQIESQVTFPIESELNGIDGLHEIRSLSKFGLSQVILVFEGQVDIYWARAQVFERLQSVMLPEGIKPE
jgi:heavy metal efflux system protein